MESRRQYVTGRRIAGEIPRPPADEPAGEGLWAAVRETGKYYYFYVLPTLLRYLKTNDPEGGSIA